MHFKTIFFFFITQQNYAPVTVSPLMACIVAMNKLIFFPIGIYHRSCVNAKLIFDLLIIASTHASFQSA